MKIEVLGPGCPKCEQLAENVQQAVRELELNIEVNKVKDFKTIASYGVMITPALVVDGELKVVGKVPSVAAIKKIIT
ncbi:thioredoxin family protein [Desulfobacca acetoxidans]|uniref:Redox-active disulfide protein 2 n=1 Tax=Desulfobacca acetoxidans (strain ATCC 700848 / DSM 11109 / ASRB2) TaxID=880072 RepID=F2NHV9_DESAR|nr:thioredoxin family protein [Desulfobacca acetoxidans]AEB09444.1 redox-active disulfide protein 2 [Desulfobacca acetoxidans DSM 11109]